MNRKDSDTTYKVLWEYIHNTLKLTPHKAGQLFILIADYVDECIKEELNQKKNRYQRIPDRFFEGGTPSTSKQCGS